MAIEQRRYKIDDLAVLNDPKAEVPAAGTVHFSVNGTEYEIDLSEKNTRKFFDAIKPYTEAGRRKPGKRRSRSTASRINSAKIRAWAREQGYKVHQQGRVPASIVAEYEAQAGTAA